MKTSKSIKINATNAKAIEAALLAANGRATAHTYTTAASILDVARRADTDLYGLLSNKKMMRGAIVTDRSGDGLPNSYRNSRVCTYITIECFGAGDWRLVDVQAVTAYNERGKTELTLTELQDERAVAMVRSGYSIKKAA